MAPPPTNSAPPKGKWLEHSIRNPFGNCVGDFRSGRSLILRSSPRKFQILNPCYPKHKVSNGTSSTGLRTKLRSWPKLLRFEVARRWHPNLIVQCLIAAEEGSQVGILAGENQRHNHNHFGICGLVSKWSPFITGNEVMNSLRWLKCKFQATPKKVLLQYINCAFLRKIYWSNITFKL